MWYALTIGGRLSLHADFSKKDQKDQLDRVVQIY